MKILLQNLTSMLQAVKKNLEKTEFEHLRLAQVMSDIN